MQFGPHAPFTDPLNVAFCANRIQWLKAICAGHYATPAHHAELAVLKARLAAYYADHVAHFVKLAQAPRSELEAQQ